MKTYIPFIRSYRAPKSHLFIHIPQFYKDCFFTIAGAGVFGFFLGGSLAVAPKLENVQEVLKYQFFGSTLGGAAQTLPPRGGGAVLVKKVENKQSQKNVECK